MSSNIDITGRTVQLPDWLWEEIDVAFARSQEYNTKSKFYQHIIETGLVSKQNIDLTRKQLDEIRRNQIKQDVENAIDEAIDDEE